MSVHDALEAQLAQMPATDLEREIAFSLAVSLDSKDNGQGKASTAKELRGLLAEIQGRQGDQVTDELDELAKKRAVRRSS